jgi:pantoate--beta-alanine ligase
MKIHKTPQALATWRRGVPLNKTIGFVPTMGALHAAHLALVKRAKKENDIVVVSIFVNPLQFGPKEDFKKYPRPWANDLKLLKTERVQILFAPDRNSMYASEDVTRVTVLGLTDTLCGAPTSRGPAHFTGVSTVVAKLFNVVRPTRAYFGLKDFQQVRIIEQMTNDLNMDIKIVRCPTVREADGLAMSSRNAYLNQHERALAPRIYAALQQGRKLLRFASPMNSAHVSRKVRAILSKTPEFRVEYVEAVDPVTLQPAQGRNRPVLLAAAVRLNKTRLIDNILVN